MAKNLDKEGLRSIVENYDIFYIDLWGVVHNGITLHKEAVKTLEQITKSKKDYVLLTNAPGHNKKENSFLENMAINKEIRKKGYSSGQASINYLKKTVLEHNFFHVVPPN